MIVYRDPNRLPESLRRGAMTIGNFDGVHCGHAKIVRQVIARAKVAVGPSIVFTFDPHPVRLLRPEQAPPPLTWPERKAELLGRLGVDAVVIYPTTRALLSWSPSEFFERIVVERFEAKAVVEGTNFYFGHGRAGDVETLRQLCDASRISLDVVEPVRVADSVVSSSVVRGVIKEGHVQRANQLLTEPFRIRGIVGRGAGRGNTIGFPTANLERIDNLIPGSGVYSGRAFVEGISYSAAINVGANPTFGESQAKVEVHLLDFSSELYGQFLEVEFVDRLRDVKRFESVNELIEQLKLDIAAVRVAAESRNFNDDLKFKI